MSLKYPKTKKTPTDFSAVKEKDALELHATKGTELKPTSEQEYLATAAEIDAMHAAAVADKEATLEDVMNYYAQLPNLEPTTPRVTIKSERRDDRSR